MEEKKFIANYCGRVKTKVNHTSLQEEIPHQKNLFHHLILHMHTFTQLILMVTGGGESSFTIKVPPLIQLLDVKSTVMVIFLPPD
jgi:hypothetical protein